MSAKGETAASGMSLHRVGSELKDFKDGFRMTPGDWGSLTQLFFDNLSTLLGALFAVQGMVGFGVPKDDINQIVWGKIVPGVGLTLLLGWKSLLHMAGHPSHQKVGASIYCSALRVEYPCGLCVCL